MVVFDVRDSFDHAGRVAHDDRIGRNIFHNHGAGADECALADYDPGEKSRVRADLGAPLDDGAAKPLLRVGGARIASVGSDDVGAEPAVIFEYGILGDKDVGVEAHAIADLDMMLDDGMRPDAHVVANLILFADQYTVPGLETVADAVPGVDDGVRTEYRACAEASFQFTRLAAARGLAEHAKVADARIGA